MAQLNKYKQNYDKTFEGGPAAHVSDVTQLERLVGACMLWEDGFYVDGVTIAEAIDKAAAKVKPEEVARIMVYARGTQHLRHVPLLLAVGLARRGQLKAEALAAIIQRPDELTEFLALYWKDGKKPLAAQVKKGLALAFGKFNEYSLAKYNSDKKAIRLRDVMRLCHPKPENAEQAALWKRLLNDELTTPDTWEVALSSGADKKETWIRLVNEGKLGGLAVLRNIRNMEQAGVPANVIEYAISNANMSRVLPFRFVGANCHTKHPVIKGALHYGLLKAARNLPKLKGRTAVLVDVSGSMTDPLSAKSDMTRVAAAAALAAIARECCETSDVYLYNTATRMLSIGVTGLAVVDAALGMCGNGTMTGASVAAVAAQADYDRIIVVTDEQSSDQVKTPTKIKHRYMVNVASYQHSIAFGSWTSITGFSESIFAYMIAAEGRSVPAEMGGK